MITDDRGKGTGHPVPLGNEQDEMRESDTTQSTLDSLMLLVPDVVHLQLQTATLQTENDQKQRTIDDMAEQIRLLQLQVQHLATHDPRLDPADSTKGHV